MDNIINSSNNEKIKNVIKLKKARERKKQDLIIIEGKREIELALKSKINIVDFFYCKEIADEKDIDRLRNTDQRRNHQVKKSVFDKITYKQNPDGFLALAKAKQLNINDVKLSSKPLILVIEGIEKPGNLGAILRTAYATGIDAVIINDPKIDIYNPNVVRASMGRIFTNQVVLATMLETKKWLQEKKINIVATSIRAKKSHVKANLKQPTAIVLGTEATGLSNEWLKIAKELIRIPMKEDIDSLNISVSTAIIIFEALRQRNLL